MKHSSIFLLTVGVLCVSNSIKSAVDEKSGKFNNVTLLKVKELNTPDSSIFLVSNSSVFQDYKTKNSADGFFDNYVRLYNGDPNADNEKIRRENELEEQQYEKYLRERKEIEEKLSIIEEQNRKDLEEIERLKKERFEYNENLLRKAKNVEENNRRLTEEDYQRREEIQKKRYEERANYKKSSKRSKIKSDESEYFY